MQVDIRNRDKYARGTMQMKHQIYQSFSVNIVGSMLNVGETAVSVWLVM